MNKKSISKTPYKQLPKLTRKQQAFVDLLKNNPKMSATQAAMQTYGKEGKTMAYSTAGSIAVENLQKPAIMLHLQNASEEAEKTVVNLLKSDNEQIKLAASKDILDRVHGRATQKVQTESSSISINIDLAPQDA